MGQDKVNLRYEPNTGNPKTVVFLYRGSEYPISYELIHQWASFKGEAPYAVNQFLAQWVEMIISPD